MLAAPASSDPVLLTGHRIELGDRLTGQRVKLGSSSLNRITSLRVELGRRLGLVGLHGHALLNRENWLRHRHRNRGLRGGHRSSCWRRGRWRFLLAALEDDDDDEEDESDANPDTDVDANPDTGWR